MTSRAHAMAVGLAMSLLLSLPAQAAGPRVAAPVQPPVKTFHPDFALLDAQGLNVLASGRAVSTMKSCGQCHDADYIARHSFHSDLGLSSFKSASTGLHSGPGLFGQWDPLRYRFLSTAGDARIDLSTPDWLMLFGPRVAGGGPGTTSRGGQPLESLAPLADNPETAHLDATGRSSAWSWKDSGTLELNCFLCHIEQPNLAARQAAIRAGRFGDASTATLAGLNLVEAKGTTWTWNRTAFTTEGLVRGRSLGIQDPTNANCGACHGEVHPSGSEPLVLQACDLDQPQTATTGQVMAGQRISASGLNIAGKAAQRRPWDIHAERQLQCTDCHHALNNPAHAQAARTDRPAHLRYDPRTLDIGQYLQRPSHELARGQSAQVHVAPESKGTMRRCENCHDAGVSHQRWLPYVNTHMRTLACESCHIPHQAAPAVQSYDWTVLSADGQPQRSCRGVQGPADDARTLLSGFDPVLMQRALQGGGSQLAPYNLVTTFYWVYDDPGGQRRPVRLLDLKAAFLEGAGHAPAIVQAFDQNRDGRLDAKELRIDTPAKQAVVKARLEGLGLKNVRMEGSVQPFSINHGVARGEYALNDCQACHGAGSRVKQGMQLAAFAPVVPVFDAQGNVARSGVFVRAADGALSYEPSSERDGVYVFGASRLSWVDRIGALAFVATLLGVSGHALLRYRAYRRRPPQVLATQRVHMYDAYRRFWHWLQAVSIIALLVTGLVIHRPDVFSALSFSGVVTLHNVLAVVLVLNAALSLFYHLATERLREYIPRPYGFFDDSIRQARYYLSGIFKGEPHPFEKRPDRRMNPIQQATYFGILNVLLPAQIVTGALMWGLQHWPEWAAAVGGLPLLGPLHSLLAWLFATFIVGHVYLTTTGPTPLEGIRAMVTGEEEVDVHEPHGAHGAADAAAAARTT